MAGLLDRAAGYAVAAVAAVPAGASAWPTPCTRWNVRQLLDHLDDSVAVLTEALADGQVEPRAVTFAERAARLPALSAARPGPVVVGGCPVRADLVSAAGALELTVHGWDLRQACGRPEPIPPDLAVGLLAVAGLVVPVTRRPLFADQVAPPPSAGPGDRLVAYLGRSPG
jgi:uncharacterized protein (TIGR03086 family)